MQALLHLEQVLNTKDYSAGKGWKGISGERYEVGRISLFCGGPFFWTVPLVLILFEAGPMQLVGTPDHCSWGLKTCVWSWFLCLHEALCCHLKGWVGEHSLLKAQQILMHPVP